MALSPTSSPSAGTEAIRPALRFGLAALATWRVTHLLASEDGPAGLIADARESLGDSPLGALMDCFQCTSIWVALPFACYATRRPGDRAVAWLALSGAACLLEAASEPASHGAANGDQAAHTEPEGDRDGVLWPAQTGA